MREIDIMEMGEQSGMAAGDSEKQVNTAIHYGPSVAAHEQQYYKANVAKQPARRQLSHLLSGLG